MSAILEIRDISIAFAGLRALDGVSLAVEQGQIFGLIGPNGAGKSTLLNCVSRLYPPSGGEILYHGSSLLRRQVHELPSLGIRRTFQNLELFRDASVRENIQLGAAFRFRTNVLADLLCLGPSRRGQGAAARRADVLLDQLGLAEHADTPVAALPYGIQKSVELARALASEPRLLLLDEPAAGMNPEESRRVGETVRSLRDTHGITIVLVEHDMRLVMSICERIAVLDHGEMICEGTPDEVRGDPAVIAAYLGEEAEDA
ncbi:MAG: ABC transporter ATP-binding protein [Burkholderiales bacterium]|nr:MAG: ABC transporter ATP-binding protein [Burkholderiales bacterium]